MVDFTYRYLKGSDLTPAEVDANMLEVERRTAIGWKNLKGEVRLDGLTNPADYTLYDGLFSMLRFASGGTHECSVIFHLQKDYVEGTGIWPHGHLIAPSSATGTVRWGFDLAVANEYDAYDMGLGAPAADQIFSTYPTTYIEHTVLPSYQNAHMVVEPSSAVTIPGLKPDSLLFMRVWRDGGHANDTYAADIMIPQIDLYYQAQGFGEAHR